MGADGNFIVQYLLKNYHVPQLRAIARSLRVRCTTRTRKLALCKLVKCEIVARLRRFFRVKKLRPACSFVLCSTQQTHHYHVVQPDQLYCVDCQCTRTVHQPVRACPCDDTHVLSVVELCRMRRARVNVHVFDNDCDPVTLEPVHWPRVFVLTENGHHYQFDPHSLHAMFVCTANFVNPFTNQEIGEADVRRLQWFMGHDANTDNVHTLWQNRKAVQESALVSAQIRTNLELLVGERVTQLCAVAQHYAWPLKLMPFARGLDDFACDQLLGISCEPVLPPDVPPVLVPIICEDIWVSLGDYDNAEIDGVRGSVAQYVQFNVLSDMRDALRALSQVVGVTDLRAQCGLWCAKLDQTRAVLTGKTPDSLVVVPFLTTALDCLRVLHD